MRAMTAGRKSEFTPSTVISVTLPRRTPRRLSNSDTVRWASCSTVIECRATTSPAGVSFMPLGSRSNNGAPISASK